MKYVLPTLVYLLAASLVWSRATVLINSRSNGQVALGVALCLVFIYLSVAALGRSRGRGQR